MITMAQTALSALTYIQACKLGSLKLVNLKLSWLDFLPRCLRDGPVRCPDVYTLGV